jgi:hypothetical protein
MIRTKITKKKNGKTDKLLRNLKSLSKNKVEIGHFTSSGLHGESDLTYPELLKGWAMGVFQEGVKKDPMSAFEFLVVRNKSMFKNPRVKAVYKKWYNNLLSPRANENFLDEMGKVLREEYASMFGKAGYLMPIVGNNTMPLQDTGELKSATAYKTSYDKQVKEKGI